MKNFLRLRKLRWEVFSPLITLIAALAITSGIVILLVDEPGPTLFHLLFGPTLGPVAWGKLLDQTVLLTLTGIGFSLAFRAGCMNLGGEGQALAGGLAAAAVAFYFPSLPRFMAIPAAMTASIVVGAFLGGLPGILLVRRGVAEHISTFLLSSTMFPLANVFLGRSIRDHQSYLIAAPPLPSAYRLVPWAPPSQVSSTLIWALLITLVAGIFLSATRLGYEWRLRGAQESFARYGGIQVEGIAVASLGISGAIHGLAGSAALLGSYGQAIQGFTSNLGWDGLAAALIARNRPILIPLAALIYTWLSHGAQAAMIHTSFPYALKGVIQATIFLLVTAQFSFLQWRKEKHA